MFENPPARIAADTPYLPKDYAFTALRHAARAREVEMRFGYGYRMPPLLVEEFPPQQVGWNAGDEQWREMASCKWVVVRRPLEDVLGVVEPI